jgi:hypothetical protein
LGDRIRLQWVLAFASFTALSCASVYDYHYHPPASDSPDIPGLATRLARVLEPQGFSRLVLARDEEAPQSSDTGYWTCPQASDLVVFMKQAEARTSVHLYACQGEARIVVIADPGARDEPQGVRDLLSHAFASELASGAIVLKHRYRIALE